MDVTNQETNLGHIALMTLKGWWFILLSCAVAAALVYFLIPQEPEAFVSRAIISGIDSDFALLPSSAVIDPVISKLGLAATDDAKIAVRQGVAEAISYRPLGGDLFELTFRWLDAGQSTTILEALITELSTQLAPRGSRREDMELEKEKLEASVATLLQFRSNILDNSSDFQGVDLAERAIAITTISDEIDEGQQSILVLSRGLQAKGDDWVKQPATFWASVQPSGRGNKIAMAVIGAGIFSAILVILAQAVMGARRRGATSGS